MKKIIPQIISQVMFKMIPKIILPVLAICMGTACGTSSSESVKPIQKDITETVFASGSLDADEKYDLTAQAEGYLSQVYFKEGEHVEINQLMAVVDNKANNANAQAAGKQLSIANVNVTDQAPGLKQLKTSIDYAEEKHTHDSLQAIRYQDLYKSQSVAKIEWENIKLEAQNSASSLANLKQQYLLLKQQAKQQLITQEASFKVNQTGIGFNQIKALDSGMVLKKYKQKGDFVKKGDVIAIVGKRSSIIARLNIDENSIAKVKAGQKCWVVLNTNKDQLLRSSVLEVLPMFEEATQSFICKVKIDTTFEPSIIATQLEANIVTGFKSKAMLIPRSFLGYGNKVKLKDSKDLITVKVGIISTEWVEILEGLSLQSELDPLNK